MSFGYKLHSPVVSAKLSDTELAMMLMIKVSKHFLFYHQVSIAFRDCAEIFILDPKLQ